MSKSRSGSFGRYLVPREFRRTKRNGERFGGARVKDKRYLSCICKEKLPRAAILLFDERTGTGRRRNPPQVRAVTVIKKKRLSTIYQLSHRHSPFREPILDPASIRPAQEFILMTSFPRCHPTNFDSSRVTRSVWKFFLKGNFLVARVPLFRDSALKNSPGFAFAKLVLIT